eukprot:TRINITY_DN1206_c0_g1_i1.p2 TRINITY_DN1206_c0_g1~~TRINITY_DN1206_c0_g1_i1.p2  ORF type:complete len:244 (+),score=14.48 TRINITY_DN1206_c0_g1_i1:1-732(+)
MKAPTQAVFVPLTDALESALHDAEALQSEKINFQIQIMVPIIVVLSLLGIVCGQTCQFAEDANGKGTHILYEDGTQDTIEDCCNLCSSYPGCNAFVYCPKPNGCVNRGNGDVLQFQYCALKYFDGLAKGGDYEFWYADNETDFASGYIEQKQAPVSTDGFCSLREPIILCQDSFFCDADNQCKPIPALCGDPGQMCCPFEFGTNRNDSYCNDELSCVSGDVLSESFCIDAIDYLEEQQPEQES